MSKINFEEDQENVIQKTGNIQSLADQVETLESLNKDIETTEEKIKNLKKKADHISAEIIPTMMSEMGLSFLRLSDGSSLEVKTNYSANITQANKEKAFNWLRENNLGDIIKNEILVSFGRNEDNKAADYAVLARGQGYEPQQKIAVHASTLRLVLEERHKEGGNIPEEFFHTFEGAQTKLKGKQ